MGAARQMGFADRRECPQLCKLASDYIKKCDGCDDNIYSFFASEPDADSLFVKLVEEFERCILSYFAFHWSQADLMISQVTWKISRDKLQFLWCNWMKFSGSGAGCWFRTQKETQGHCHGSHKVTFPLPLSVLRRILILKAFFLLLKTEISFYVANTIKVDREWQPNDWFSCKKRTTSIKNGKTIRKTTKNKNKIKINQKTNFASNLCRSQSHIYNVLHVNYITGQVTFSMNKAFFGKCPLLLLRIRTIFYIDHILTLFNWMFLNYQVWQDEQYFLN